METKNPYQERLKNWEIEKNKDCPNYARAKEWAIKNGFTLQNDVSYNGFIYLIKTICETEDLHDGHEIELQVYDGTDDRKYHDVQQSDKEADFGNIMDETKYRYKTAHGVGTSFSSQNLENVFDAALNLEKKLTIEHIEWKKQEALRNALWEKSPELKDKYYADLLESLRTNCK